jgi:hypothetical protein
MYTRLLYHIVFSTKERAACIGEQLRPRLHAYLGGEKKKKGDILVFRKSRMSPFAAVVRVDRTWNAEESCEVK